MDLVQQSLFGKFPRRVAVTTPDNPGSQMRQYMVHSPGELDGVVERVSGERNLYCSISSYPQYWDSENFGYSVQSDKVSFDLDSTAKSDREGQRWDCDEIPDSATDRWVFDNLNEKDVRESVLGTVCEEARELSQASMDQDIPIVGVFSGLGLHIHQLYEKTEHRVEDKLLSNSSKWVDELGLESVDGQATGRMHRLMRYPNYERLLHSCERMSTGVYTVPIKGSELTEITPEELCELSRTPRIFDGVSGVSRPSMGIQEDYLGPTNATDTTQEDMRSVPAIEIGDDTTRTIIKRITRMPCVYKRALSRNPSNEIRVKLAIMILNAGYTVKETVDLIESIGWVDFDRETTEYQVESLRKSGKGDWSCKEMQRRGLCVMADNKIECEMYGYRGGNVPR